MQHLIGLLLLGISVLNYSPTAVAATGKNKASSSYHAFYTIEDRDGVIDIEMNATISASTLFNEPVIACNANWKIRSIPWVDKQPTTFVPKDVKQETYIYDVTLAFPTHDKKYLICDPGVFYSSGDPKYSFTVPGSPSWNKTFRYLSFMKSDNKSAGYADRDEAKDIMREIFNKGFPEAHSANQKRLKVISAKVNLQHIKRWLNKKKLERDEKQYKKQQAALLKKQQITLNSDSLDDDTFDAFITAANTERGASLARHYLKVSKKGKYTNQAEALAKL